MVKKQLTIRLYQWSKSYLYQNPKTDFTMKILKVVLMIVGVVLVVMGLYNAFVPQEVASIGPLEVNAKEGLSNQTLGMIGIGVFALVAGVLIKERR